MSRIFSSFGLAAILILSASWLAQPGSGEITFAAGPTADEEASEVAPLKILLATGGGYHDYETQSKILKEGLEERIHCEVTVVMSGELKHPAFPGPGWAKDYDFVIHNLCNAGNADDPSQVEVITAEHKAGTPAAVLHCSMHCYRARGPHEYQAFLGVVSRAHEKHHPITISRNSEQPDHPIMAGFPDTWETPKGELYRILDVMPGVTELASGVASEQQVHMCYWTHQYGEAKIFGTTIGHHNETMRERVYLDTLARGILWATDHIEPSGAPKPGYGRALE
jgi:uncharacterized protein